MSLYDTLGVDKSATAGQLRDAYRDKAKVMHPDKGGDRSEFALLASAYNVLSDAKKRTRYDETGIEDDVFVIDRKASSMICGLFQALIDDVGLGGVLGVDVTKRIEKALDIMLVKMDTEEKNVVIKKKALEKVAGRVKHKDKNNILVMMLEQDILVAVSGLGIIKEQREITKTALVMLKDYEFSFDEPFEVFSSVGQSTATSFSGFYDSHFST